MTTTNNVSLILQNMNALLNTVVEQIPEHLIEKMTAIYTSNNGEIHCDIRLEPQPEMVFYLKTANSQHIEIATIACSKLTQH